MPFETFRPSGITYRPVQGSHHHTLAACLMAKSSLAVSATCTDSNRCDFNPRCSSGQLLTRLLVLLHA
jgi:hypothetical protein